MSVDVPVQLDYCSETVDPHTPAAGATSEWYRILASARAGDDEALGRLLQQLRDYLLLVADREFDRRLQAKAGASDLVQNTLLEAGRDIQAFRGNSEAELRAWLVRILRHNAMDLAREFCSTRRRDVQREQRLSGMAHVLLDRGRGASSIIRRAEADEQLDRAVDQLPDRYQQIISLRHEYGLSWKEIGRQMSISAEAARKTWARAIRKLRDHLSQEHATKVDELSPANHRRRTSGAQPR